MIEDIENILIHTGPFSKRKTYTGKNERGEDLIEQISIAAQSDETFVILMDAIVWENNITYNTTNGQISKELCKMIFEAMYNRVDREPSYGEFAIRVLNRVMRVDSVENTMRECILKSIQHDIQIRNRLKLSNNKRYISTIILLSEFYLQVLVKGSPFTVILTTLLECLTDLLNHQAADYELEIAIKQLTSLRYILYSTCTKVQWVALRNSIKDAVIFVKGHDNIRYSLLDLVEEYARSTQIKTVARYQ